QLRPQPSVDLFDELWSEISRPALGRALEALGGSGPEAAPLLLVTASAPPLRVERRLRAASFAGAAAVIATGRVLESLPPMAARPSRGASAPSGAALGFYALFDSVADGM